MNKEQFLVELESSLYKLNDEERNDILNDFSEHFDMGLEEGKTEEEIASSLGSPQHIAKELLATHHLEKVKKETSAGNVLRAVWAVIGLGFFNLVVVLGPFIAVLGIILAGWITGGAFILSPLLVVIKMVIFPSTFQSFDLFASIGLVGAGILITLGMLYITRLVIKGFVRYLQFNVNIVKGGMKNE